MCTLNSANRDRVIKFDGVDLMVTFMNKHPTNEAIQQEACLAINNLCINNGKGIILVINWLCLPPLNVPNVNIAGFSILLFYTSFTYPIHLLDEALNCIAPDFDY